MIEAQNLEDLKGHDAYGIIIEHSDAITELIFDDDARATSRDTMYDMFTALKGDANAASRQKELEEALRTMDDNGALLACVVFFDRMFYDDIEDDVEDLGYEIDSYVTTDLDSTAAKSVGYICLENKELG